MENTWNATNELGTNFILTWSASCVTVSCTDANQTAIFAITDTKVYVLQ